ncbi:lytic transglycosylase domain-containing protein [Sphingomonas sp.]|uniref:lytic transglycosylase domain-containing protein n=1 Tax=Sphingomonas sp. TaxID=28214 RepID=UPI0025F66525|nr:lytic transglycosylase domain-containing protein [Sphingomonas sp.]
MKIAYLIAASVLALTPVVASPAFAAGDPPAAATMSRGIPAQLDADQRAGYRAVFKAIREQRWVDAQIQLTTMKPGPLHSIAAAELYLAKGSPKVDNDPLLAVISNAPELPQAPAIAKILASRGVVAPGLPVPQKLVWANGASTRGRAKPTKYDLASAELALKMQPFIKGDMGPEAQALLEATPNLTPDAQTEWQQRVAWIYFLQGDDNNARMMAAKAALGSGDWSVQGQWVGGLAAWRQGDCTAAGEAFVKVAARASDVELRAAGLYWAARADMKCDRPQLVEGRLKNAAQLDETFYGMLARQQLGIKEQPRSSDELMLADWDKLQNRPNVRVAAALVEIGETDLADSVLKQQAKIGPTLEYASLVRLTETLDLPETLMWLGNNCPQGAKPPTIARFPAPKWTPDGGWTIDKALVYAHALQESRFKRNVVSPAGAYGLMQIMPAAAIDYARERGITVDRGALTMPSVNMAVGQRTLERLASQSFANGSLIKVMAAYNAGPVPVTEWNSIVKDGGDPLLYIESIPYWETRGYVTTVMRNYWMYEAKDGRLKSPSREALAQGKWPKFPGAK